MESEEEVKNTQEQETKSRINKCWNIKRIKKT